MKRFLFLLIAILIHANIALATTNNLLDRNWWKTATIDDVKKELKKGADINAIEKEEGLNALIMASSVNRNCEIIKMLIDAGANVNSKTKNGRTVLMMAAAFNPNPEVVKLLIKAGADVNAKSDNQRTALSCPMFEPSPEVIKALINAGADVNAKDDDGATPLMYIVSGQNPDAIKTLLKAGANVNDVSNNGTIAAINASLNKDPKIHSLILQSMDIKGYCKLTRDNSFDISLCIDQMTIYAQKEYILPTCTNNMAAVLYLNTLLETFSHNTPNDRKTIGWLTLAEGAKQFNCSLGKTMYSFLGGEEIHKNFEEALHKMR